LVSATRLAENLLFNLPRPPYSISWPCQRLDLSHPSKEEEGSRNAWRGIPESMAGPGGKGRGNQAGRSPTVTKQVELPKAPGMARYHQTPPYPPHSSRSSGTLPQKEHNRLRPYCNLKAVPVYLNSKRRPANCWVDENQDQCQPQLVDRAKGTSHLRATRRIQEACLEATGGEWPVAALRL
jgi:hypothetical protein